MEYINNGPYALIAIGAVLSAFTAGLYIGIKIERSRCVQWIAQSDKENKRLVENARG